MKKIINKPANYVSESLSGIYKAHVDKIRYVNRDRHCLVRKENIPNKVGIVTGGGSGHLPLFLGYVGDGLLDGCAIGEVFRSPNSEQVYEVTKAVDAGQGVLYILGNYNGDIFNFNIGANNALNEDGIQTSTVIVGDDISSIEKNTRRGIAGLFYVYKCAGAAASQMMNLEEVTMVAEKAKANTRSMGIALTPCVIPNVGKETFHSSEYEIEIGVGIHGEPGVKRSNIMTAAQIADKVMKLIMDDLDLKSNDKVSVLINGLGATPLEEQYLMYNSVQKILTHKKIDIGKVFIGEFATTMETAGLSISVIKLDEQLEKLINMPADAIMYQQT